MESKLVWASPQYPMLRNFRFIVTFPMHRLEEWSRKWLRKRDSSACNAANEHIPVISFSLPTSKKCLHFNPRHLMMSEQSRWPSPHAWDISRDIWRITSCEIGFSCGIDDTLFRCRNAYPHPSSKMTPHLKPLRRLSFSRLKYFAAACIFAIITYRYVYRNPALRLGSKPRDAAGNSTLGVSFSRLFL